MTYKDFLETKRERVNPVGFDIGQSDINPRLFDWQSVIVRWALQRGRAALFEDCGLGKTAQQLEFARHVVKHTGRAVLILAPLAVADQTVREGEKFGVDIGPCPYPGWRGDYYRIRFDVVQPYIVAEGMIYPLEEMPRMKEKKGGAA